jgi:gluconate 2-dehydrogenase gamma chain
MSESSKERPTRRDFLKKAVTLTGVVPLTPQLFRADPPGGAVSSAQAPLWVPAATYRSLNPEAAAFTEAMVNVLCPADHLTPNGVTCGLASFIDRKLAGDFGAQPSSLLPLTREQFFKRGVTATNGVSRERFGVRFDQLAASDASVLLRDIAAGRVTDVHLSLASWSKELVHPLLVQAAFSGPIYDGYYNRVFWKLFVL